MSTLNLKELDLSSVKAKENQKFVVAIDGPAASGKGTLGKKLAERLGYAFLDTGALYRVVALAVIEMGGDPSKIEDVRPALEIVKRNLTPELLNNASLRDHKVSDAASKLSALPEVRIELIEYQREFAKTPPEAVGGAILDGRDIGTVICPNADIKFFVTASPEERAKRRFEDLKSRNSNITYEQVLEDVKIRDERDSTRKMSPAIPAEDAYIIDTTNKNADEVIEEAVSIISDKFLSEVSLS